MGHRADARGSMGWQRGEVAIITVKCCLLRPSSPFSPAISATPAFDLGIEILGLLIYTYETKQSRLKITGVFGDLRGKM